MKFGSYPKRYLEVERNNTVRIWYHGPRYRFSWANCKNAAYYHNGMYTWYMGSCSHGTAHQIRFQLNNWSCFIVRQDNKNVYWDRKIKEI